MAKTKPEKKSVIKISAVSKSFKEVRAVKGVSLDVYEGEYLALLGPNGAGKTTLIEMIEGIQKPDSGSIEILGRTMKDNETSLRREMGISLQETRFIDKLTVYETISLFASFYGIKSDDCMEIVELAGLDEKLKSYVVNLSGGQRQKLALCIALINRPRILLLDEPTTGLDPNARREIWNIVKNLKKTGTTMILTTHYMEEAEDLCDRIVIMHRGEFIADGTLDQLVESHGCCGMIEFSVSGKISKEDILKIKGVSSVVSEKNGSFTILVSDNVSVMPRLISLVNTRKLKLAKLTSRQLSLDDIFISMTGMHLDD